MRVAVLGATSQIAGDYVRAALAAGTEFLLYARDPGRVRRWLDRCGLAGAAQALPYESYGEAPHDAVINFVGVGDPSRAAAMGSSIFDITLRFDDLVMRHLRDAPGRRYIFLSSGAVYGTGFAEPAGEETPACVNVNRLAPQEFYSVAKLHAECRHRALAQFPIVDIRVFNYYSRTQDLGARFFVTDMIRAARDGTRLATAASTMTRDYLHPADFHRLVEAILAAPARNAAVDCYSRSPVEKFELLERFRAEFGLAFDVTAATGAAVNATGAKPNYYSTNRAAAALFGYEPSMSSVDAVVTEARAALREPAVTNQWGFE
jgi:nucleoside-diphosphate-sugar epimerase